MSSCFRKVFSLQENEISINHPFAGGYITRKYGSNPLPWIQVELNRALYLKKPFDERNIDAADMNRINELGKMFDEALRLFF